MPRSFRWMEPTFGPSQTSRHATPPHSATPSTILHDYTHDNARRDTQIRKSGTQKPARHFTHARRIAVTSWPGHSPGRAGVSYSSTPQPAPPASNPASADPLGTAMVSLAGAVPTARTAAGIAFSAPKPAGGKVAALPSLRHTNASAVSGTPRVPMCARPSASCGCRTRSSLGRAFLFRDGSSTAASLIARPCAHGCGGVARGGIARDTKMQSGPHARAPGSGKVMGASVAALPRGAGL